MTAEIELCWSFDGENFNYDSLRDLIDANRDELQVGSVVEFGTKVEYSASRFVPKSDWVFEQMQEQAYDVGGEFSEDFPDVSDEGAAELDALLKAWAEKHVTVNFWTVANTQEYTITAEDLAP